MKITVLDTETGEKKTVCGQDPYEFEDGNWSCDCNRQSLFEIDEEFKYCKSDRYIICKFEAENFEEESSIYDLNSDYSRDLIDKWVKPCWYCYSRDCQSEVCPRRISDAHRFTIIGRRLYPKK